MTIDELLRDGAPPVIAILRGVKPSEVVDVAAALVDAGIRIIEVPLNSPDSFASIGKTQARFGNRALIGAGTVLGCASVDRLAETGAGLLVAPNSDAQVISRGVALGLEVMPGFVTPSEAFAAIQAGARKLKLFPASATSPHYISAIRDVVPADVAIWAVGGVDVARVNDWLAAGAEGVAIGGALYQPGRSPADVGAVAAKIIASLGG